MIRLYLKVPENFMGHTFSGKFWIVHILFVNMVKQWSLEQFNIYIYIHILYMEQFSMIKQWSLEQFSIDHLSHPVITALVFLLRQFADRLQLIHTKIFGLWVSYSPQKTRGEGSILFGCLTHALLPSLINTNVIYSVAERFTLFQSMTECRVQTSLAQHSRSLSNFCWQNAMVSSYLTATMILRER